MSAGAQPGAAAAVPPMPDARTAVATAPTAPPMPELVGSTLDDRYLIVSLLGEGGMGRVYRARQVAVERDVAVKVIRPLRWSDPRATRRFIDEARAVASLAHPNIVTVHDFGRTPAGVFYLVMELLRGTPLRRVVEAGPVPLGRALQIGVQLCAALEQAHRRALVHLDLKPENVMLCAGDGLGELAKILDFGVARVVAASSPVGLGGRAVGTPAYMSPEQAEGGLVDARSDLYALGVVLHELLCGALPDARRQLPARVARQLPAALVELVASLLAPLREERPSDAGLVRAQLAQLGGAPGATAVAGSAGGARVELARARDAPAAPPASVAPPRPPGLAPAGEAPWSVGAVVAARYVLTRVERGDGVERAAATDLRAHSRREVALTRVAVRDGEVAGALELAVERWSSMLRHFRHARLCGVLDAYLEPGALVVASEAADGAPLAELLQRRGRLPVADVLALARALCDGLEHLHALGLGHGAVCPAAVHLDGRGEAALAQTGVSLLVEAGAALGTGQALGVGPVDPRYLAPELLGAGGDGVARASAAGDLYGLGGVLYTALTGLAPWATVASQDLGAARARLAPVAPSQLVAGIPPELDALVLRLLRTAPEERLGSAAALARALRRLDPASTDGGASSLGEPAPLLGLDAEGPLVGREPARALGRDLLERARAGQGGVLVFTGDSGVGKSRLVHELGGDVRRAGGLTLVTRARPGAAPLAAIEGLFVALDAALVPLGPELRQRALERLQLAAGEQGALLRPLAPVLARLFEHAPPPPPLDEGAAHARLVRVAADALVAVAAPLGPLALVLDDWQWADATSRAVATRVAAASGSEALLLLVAARRASGSASDDSPGGFATEPSDAGAPLGLAGARVVPLEGLGRDALAAWVHARLGDAPGVAACVETLAHLSDGNPVALRALLVQAERLGALVEAPGGGWHVDPERLSLLRPAEDVVARMAERLRALPWGTRAALGAAALLGGPFDVPTLEALLAGDADADGAGPRVGRAELVALLVEAERAGIVRPMTGGHRALLDFSHDALRAAAAETFEPRERRRLHRRAAEALAARAPDDPNALHALARHLEQADRRPADVAWLERAARAALERQGGEAAVRFARAAVERLPVDAPASARFALERLVAQGLAAQRRVAAAAEHLGGLLAWAPDAAAAVSVRRELARHQHVGGRLTEAARTLEEALALGGGRHARGRIRSSLTFAARLGAAALGAYNTRGARAVSAGAAAPAAASAAEAESPAAARAALWLQLAETLFFVDPTGSAAANLEALHEGRRASARVRSQALATTSAVVCLGLGWVGAGIRLARAALAEAERAADPAVRALVQTYVLRVFDAAGDVDTVDALLPDTQALVGRVGDPWLEAAFLSIRAEVALQRGELEAALAATTAMTRVVADNRVRDWMLSWARCYGALAAAQAGQPALVLRLVDAPGLAVADPILRGTCLSLGVQALAGLGRFDEALERAETHLGRAGAAFAPRYYAAGEYCTVASGLALVVAGRGADARTARLVSAVLTRGRFAVQPFRWHRHYLDFTRGALGRGLAPRSARLRAARRIEAEPRAHLASLVVLRDSALLEGAMSTALGRRQLEAAHRLAERFDPRLPLRHELDWWLGRRADRLPADPARRAAPLFAPLAEALGAADALDPHDGAGRVPRAFLH